MAGRTPMSDNDQYNRIFIIGAKDCSSADIREAFQQFGEITDVYMPRGKSPHEDKGIAYVTYSKASEAALAMETMNGKSVKDSSRHVKVVLANSKRQGNVRDRNEEEKMLRLFIMIPPAFSEKDVQDEFSKFGEVKSVQIVKDAKTKNSRGLAYVRFGRAYDAAVALENCDPKFKPMFADSPRPRWSGDSDRRSYSSPATSLSSGHLARSSMDYDRPRLLEAPRRTLPPPAAPAPAPAMLDMLRNYSQQTETVLEASMCPSLSYEHVSRLFDIIPGMDTCHYDHNTGKAHVKYMSAQAAAYARDKLDMFEYPPGYRMTVQYIARSRDVFSGGALPTGGDTLTGVQTLVDSIQKAMTVLQQAGAGNQVSAGGGAGGGSYSHLALAPPAAYSHQGKRSHTDDDGYRSLSARKSSRFS